MSLSLVALGFLVFVVLLAGGVAFVLALVTRRPRRPFYDQDDVSSPLERARDAAAALSPREWEAFRRWVAEQRQFPTRGGEGITQ